MWQLYYIEKRTAHFEFRGKLGFLSFGSAEILLLRGNSLRVFIEAHFLASGVLQNFCLCNCDPLLFVLLPVDPES